MHTAIIQGNHYSVEVTKDISELMLPLRQYEIEHFGHVRLFPDHSMSVLVDNKESYQHHIRSEYRALPSFPYSFQELQEKPRYYLATLDSEETFSAAMYDFRNLFGLENFLYLLDGNEHYIDVFFFASFANNKKIINFYLNQMDVLEQFKLDFKHKASKLIVKGDRNRIILPENMQVQLGQVNTVINNEFHLRSPMKQGKRQYNIINYLGKTIQFTKREIDCLYLFKAGYTAKEVAIQLGLSTRTIESHINNIKFKFGVKRKPDIIKAFTKSW